jgi:hypothetical protein
LSLGDRSLRLHSRPLRCRASNSGREETGKYVEVQVFCRSWSFARHRFSCGQPAATARLNPLPSRL